MKSRIVWIGVVLGGKWLTGHLQNSVVQSEVLDHLTLRSLPQLLILPFFESLSESLHGIIIGLPLGHAHFVSQCQHVKRCFLWVIFVFIFNILYSLFFN